MIYELASQPLRSLLFVPAHRRRMVAKARALGADAVVLDLEDAVPPAEKAAARADVRAAIEALAPSAAVFVRVNSIGTGLTRDDVLAAIVPGLAAVVLPKIRSPQEVRDLDVLLREAESASGVRPGDVAVMPLIETPRGLLRIEEIAAASDRVVALSVGAEDYCAELEVERTAAGTAIAHLRYRVVAVAAAHGLLAIDTPYGDIRDAAGLAAEAEFARAIGYKGKYAVHPDQVEPINRAFTPSPADIARARDLIAQHEAATKSGAGASSVDGRMVDAPVVRRAQQLLARADAIAAKSRARSR